MKVWFVIFRGDKFLSTFLLSRALSHGPSFQAVVPQLNAGEAFLLSQALSPKSQLNAGEASRLLRLDSAPKAASAQGLRVGRTTGIRTPFTAFPPPP